MTPWSPLDPEPITGAQLVVALAGGLVAAFVAWAFIYLLLAVAA